MFEKIFSKDPDEITVKMKRSLVLDMLHMINIGSQNLQVFMNTPSYAVDREAIKFMFINNMYIGSYLMDTTGITPEEVYQRFKRSMDEGELKLSDPVEEDVPEVKTIEGNVPGEINRDAW